MKRILLFFCLIFVIPQVFGGNETISDKYGKCTVDELLSRKAELVLQISHYSADIEQAEKARKEAKANIDRAQEVICTDTRAKEKAEVSLSNAEKDKANAEETIIECNNVISELNEEITKIDEEIKKAGISEDEAKKSLAELLENFARINRSVQAIDSIISNAKLDKERAEREKEAAVRKDNTKLNSKVPNCKKVSYTAEDDSTRCFPSAELLGATRKDPPNWKDAVRLCVAPGSGECFRDGYCITGLDHVAGGNVRGEGTIPKGVQGYVRFLKKFKPTWVTIKNHATGEVVQLDNDYTIPCSETQDQRITFEDNCGGDGIVVLTVKEENEDKEATATARREAQVNIQKANADIQNAEDSRIEAEKSRKAIEPELKVIQDNVSELSANVTGLTKKREDVEALKIGKKSIIDQKTANIIAWDITRKRAMEIIEQSRGFIEELDRKIVSGNEQYDNKYGSSAREISKLGEKIKDLESMRKPLIEELKALKAVVAKLLDKKEL